MARTYIKKIIAYFKTAVRVIFGCLLFAAGFNMFILPHDIVMGGATGLATLISIFTGLPVGLLVIALNIPLVLLATLSFGIRRLPKILIGIFTTSIALDLLNRLPAATDDLLLSALFGGGVMGLGIGLLFREDVTTGGSDLAAYIIAHRSKKLKIGELVLLIDGVIILASALVLGRWQLLFYSVITAVTYSLTIDRTITGANRAKLVYVISSEPETLASCMQKELGRGVTLLYGKGKYTDEDRRIIMCAIKPSQLSRLKAIINSSDSSSFMIITDAKEVLGLGFGDYYC